MGGGQEPRHAIPNRSPKGSALEPSILAVSHLFLVGIMIYLYLTWASMNLIHCFPSSWHIAWSRAENYCSF